LSIKTTVLLHITDYRWMKNSVEDLALVQNQFARNPLKAKPQDSSSWCFVDRKSM